MSPNGSTVYAAVSASICGYDIATGVQVYDSGVTGHLPDGTGVMSGASIYADDVVVFNNDGTVGLLDPTGTNPYLTIATGAQRGDLVSADGNNGSLLMADYYALYRLGCGAGCAIGSGPTAQVPEPASLGLFTLGLAGLRWSSRRKPT